MAKPGFVGRLELVGSVGLGCLGE